MATDRNSSGREVSDRRSVAYFQDLSLEDIEEAIRETQQAVDSALLSMCIAIAAIDVEAKYAEAGYRSMREYLAEADGRIELPKVTLWNYLQIGHAFLKHRQGLIRHNYSEQDDGIHKLRHIDDALTAHRPDTVYRNLKAMSYRQFYDWSRSNVGTTETRDPQELTEREADQLLREAKRIRGKD